MQLEALVAESVREAEARTAEARVAEAAREAAARETEPPPHLPSAGAAEARLMRGASVGDVEAEAALEQLAQVSREVHRRCNALPCSPMCLKLQPYDLPTCLLVTAQPLHPLYPLSTIACRRQLWS